MRYLEPETVEEAVDLLAEHGDAAKVIAGGQSLLILMRERLVEADALIGLRAIPALREIEVNGGVRIGAMVTHSAVERDERIAAGWPLLRDAEAAVSTLQVRNRGTLGGNVAHAFPTADPPRGSRLLWARRRIAHPCVAAFSRTRMPIGSPPDRTAPP